MNLGRVIGTVVATQKCEGLQGKKFLVVQPLDHALRSAGEPIVAVDTVRAGPGELIYFVNSREAALALEVAIHENAANLDTCLNNYADKLAIVTAGIARGFKLD